MKLDKTPKAKQKDPHRYALSPSLSLSSDSTPLSKEEEKEREQNIRSLRNESLLLSLLDTWKLAFQPEDFTLLRSIGIARVLFDLVKQYPLQLMTGYFSSTEDALNACRTQIGKTRGKSEDKFSLSQYAYYSSSWAARQAFFSLCVSSIHSTCGVLTQDTLPLPQGTSTGHGGGGLGAPGGSGGDGGGVGTIPLSRSTSDEVAIENTLLHKSTSSMFSLASVDSSQSMDFRGLAMDPFQTLLLDYLIDISGWSACSPFPLNERPPKDEEEERENERKMYKANSSEMDSRLSVSILLLACTDLRVRTYLSVSSSCLDMIVTYLSHPRPQSFSLHFMRRLLRLAAVILPLSLPSDVDESLNRVLAANPSYDSSFDSGLYNTTTSTNKAERLIFGGIRFVSKLVHDCGRLNGGQYFENVWRTSFEVCDGISSQLICLVRTLVHMPLWQPSVRYVLAVGLRSFSSLLPDLELLSSPNVHTLKNPPTWPLDQDTLRNVYRINGALDILSLSTDAISHGSRVSFKKKGGDASVSTAGTVVRLHASRVWVIPDDDITSVLALDISHVSPLQKGPAMHLPTRNYNIDYYCKVHMGSLNKNKIDIHPELRTLLDTASLLDLKAMSGLFVLISKQTQVESEFDATVSLGTKLQLPPLSPLFIPSLRVRVARAISELVTLHSPHVSSEERSASSAESRLEREDALNSRRRMRHSLLHDLVRFIPPSELMEIACSDTPEVSRVDALSDNALMRAVRQTVHDSALDPPEFLRHENLFPDSSASHIVDVDTLHPTVHTDIQAKAESVFRGTQCDVETVVKRWVCDHDSCLIQYGVVGLTPSHMEQLKELMKVNPDFTLDLCERALLMCDGDFEQAQAWLEEHGEEEIGETDPWGVRGIDFFQECGEWSGEPILPEEKYVDFEFSNHSDKYRRGALIAPLKTLHETQGRFKAMNAASETREQVIARGVLALKPEDIRLGMTVRVDSDWVTRHSRYYAHSDEIQLGAIKWYILTDDNNWAPFSVEESTVLEERYAQGVTSALVPSDAGVESVVRFDKMCMYNELSGYGRPIKRKYVPGPRLTRQQKIDLIKAEEEITDLTGVEIGDSEEEEEEEEEEEDNDLDVEDPHSKHVRETLASLGEEQLTKVTMVCVLCIYLSLTILSLFCLALCICLSHSLSLFCLHLCVSLSPYLSHSLSLLLSHSLSLCLSHFPNTSLYISTHRLSPPWMFRSTGPPWL